MKVEKEIAIPFAALAFAIYVWARKTGALDEVPGIGPFFWPNSVPGSVREWTQTVVDNVSSEWRASVMAVIWQESNGQHYLGDGSVIRGADGEIGLCQILPSTGLGLGFSESDLMDPVKNIMACETYLREGFQAWTAFYSDIRPDLGVASLHDVYRYYNGGPRVVNDYERWINLSRTYADSVAHKWDVLTSDSTITINV